MMTLDLLEILGDWESQAEKPMARLVTVGGGHQFVQLRIDVGLLQMALNGRPDGGRFHGMPTAQDHIVHENRVVGAKIAEADWHELVRELNQVNYRRLALAELADHALASDHRPRATRMLTGAIRDARFARASVALLESASHERLTVSDGALLPTLLFSQYRLTAQLCILQGRMDDGIESVETGIRELHSALEDLGVETDEITRDEAIVSLREFSRQLRETYETPRTLRERLADAVECEDFATAAALRREIADSLAEDDASAFAFTVEI